MRDLADRVAALQPGERVAVAVDGVDGVGKTMLADQLAEMVAVHRAVLRVGVDGFHHPRVTRYARGTGPETFYSDSYDYAALRRSVLEPFRAGTPVTPAVFDVDADLPVDADPIAVGPDTVLLVDGIFLQRPELAHAWDAVVFVDAAFTVTVARGNARYPGYDDDPQAESNRRYVAGQRLYLEQVRPRERATWAFDNTDLRRPRLTPPA